MVLVDQIIGLPVPNVDQSLKSHVAYSLVAILDACFLAILSRILKENPIIRPMPLQKEEDALLSKDGVTDR